MSVALLIAAAALVPSARDLLPSGPAAPGCALDVRRAGEPIETVVGGLANLENPEPIAADTVFEIGSVSKQFIGAGLAILASRGTIDLDDPIRKWLPELPALYRDVTVRMLAHHTSGIRSWNNLAELTGRGEDSTGYDNRWVLDAVARQRRLNHAPGSEYLYSNSNSVLAAIIIERASGQELNQFFSEALFDRLGMTRTRWRVDFREIVPGRAQAYGPAAEPGRWRLDMPLNGVAGAGGLLSTVGDLQKWTAFIADPPAADRGWVAALLRPGRLNDGSAITYAMGLETAPIDGRAAVSHAGSTGSYRAWLGYFPAERLSVALLCNSGALNTEDLGPEVAARFLPASQERAAATSLSAPANLAGRYRNAANDAAVEVSVDASGLRLNGGVAFGTIYGNRLATADGRRTAQVRRDAAGRATRLIVSRIGNAPVVLERAEIWSPTPAELGGLAGTYRSAEVDGAHAFLLGPAGLQWRDPSGVVQPLVPTYRNAFAAPDSAWTLRFIRGPRGAVSLDLSITRARRIRFERTAP